LDEDGFNLAKWLFGDATSVNRWRVTVIKTPRTRS
jgi:hypothetical protein